MATLRELLDQAGAALGAAGVPQPRREAIRLWADLHHASPAAVRLPDHREVAAGEAETFRHAVGRRAAGEPLPHIVGWTGFRTLVLRTDRRALIPRPETEGLVELVLARAPGGRVADIGTGTGCIALSLAAEGRYDRIVAVELSPDALALARANRAATGLRIHLVRGDLTQALGDGSLDALVSNPPYLTEAEYAALDPGVRDWEPRPALPSGADGLEATRRLLDDGCRVLRPGGLLALEVDATRATEVAGLAQARGWADVAMLSDLFGRERYLLARRSEST